MPPSSTLSLSIATSVVSLISSILLPSTSLGANMRIHTQTDGFPDLQGVNPFNICSAVVSDMVFTDDLSLIQQLFELRYSKGSNPQSRKSVTPCVTRA